MRVVSRTVKAGTVSAPAVEILDNCPGSLCDASDDKQGKDDAYSVPQGSERPCDAEECFADNVSHDG